MMYDVSCGLWARISYDVMLTNGKPVKKSRYLLIEAARYLNIIKSSMWYLSISSGPII